MLIRVTGKELPSSSCIARQCQLQENVRRHSNIIKDLLDLIWIIWTMYIDAVEQIRRATADVGALYPSFRLQRLERGMAALQWFMDYHTSFSHAQKDLCHRLAHMVFINNFVVCKEPEHPNSNGNVVLCDLCSNLYDTAGNTDGGNVRFCP